MQQSGDHRVMRTMTILCVSAVLGSSCSEVVTGRGRALPSAPASSASASERTTLGGGSRQVVWVALEDAHKIARVNLRRRRVVRRLKVSGRPHNIAVNRAGLVATALWNNERVALVKGRWRKGVRIPGAPHD